MGLPHKDADMQIGVPKEVKDHEDRVGLVPSSVAELVHHGHQVIVEAGAGVGSGLPDAEYAAAGATLREGAEPISLPWAIQSTFDEYRRRLLDATPCA